jgi:hypothetical protein
LWDIACPMNTGRPLQRFAGELLIARDQQSAGQGVQRLALREIAGKPHRGRRGFHEIGDTLRQPMPP